MGGIVPVEEEGAHPVPVRPVRAVIELQPPIGDPDRHAARADPHLVPRVRARQRDRPVMPPVDEVVGLRKPDPEHAAERAGHRPGEREVEVVHPLGEEHDVLLIRVHHHPVPLEGSEVLRGQAARRDAEAADRHVGDVEEVVDPRDPWILDAVLLEWARRLDRGLAVDLERHAIATARDAQVRDVRQIVGELLVPRGESPGGGPVADRARIR